MSASRLLIVMVACFACCERGMGSELAFENPLLPDVKASSGASRGLARLDGPNQIDEWHYQEVIARQTAAMSSLEELAVISLSIAPSFSSLGSPSVDGQEAVSYNQWLATSFVSGSSAAPMQLAKLTLRLSAAVRNSHTFIGITESAGGRPDLQHVVSRMDSTALSTMPLNTALNVELVPEVGSEPGTLLPDREYWVVFGVEALDHSENLATGLYYWSYTESMGPFESDPQWAVSTRTATGNTVGQNWSSFVQSPQSFSVVLSPIPEPNTILLLLTALSMTCFQRRRAHRYEACC